MPLTLYAGLINFEQTQIFLAVRVAVDAKTSKRNGLSKEGHTPAEISGDILVCSRGAVSLISNQSFKEDLWTGYT